MHGRAGGTTGDGAGGSEEEDAPTGRYLVTESNVRSAWTTGALLLAIVALEGLAVEPLFLLLAVPLGPVMYYVLNQQLGAGKRGLATIGLVAAFVAAVLLGFMAEAIWVTLGVDLGTLVVAYGERWLLGD